MDHLDNTLRYVYSSSLDFRIPIKIGTLEGLKDKPPHEKLLKEPLLRFSGLYSEVCPSLMVRLQIYNNGDPFGLPITTSFKAFTKRWSWNEWIQLPLQFSDLPRTAMLALTILDCAGAGKTSIIGGTTISLFGKYGLFRQGMFDLRVWIDVVADGNSMTTTPGKIKACKNSNKNQMQRLAKLAKKHRNGQIPQVDWLDRLTFREIEVINKKEKTESDYLYLLIEFPTIISGEHTYSIIYYEPDGDQKYTFISKPKLVTVPDSEISQTNLVERKHHRLARSARSGLSDRDAKPTASVRDQLHTIVYRYPPTATLTGEEQDLVWKFRFYLSTQKKALTKFLKCINWGTATEVSQATALLLQWAPMDVEDALELLSPTFKHPTVRRYAISRLKQAPDDDLLLYLLQLVQALKYENFNDIDTTYKCLTPDNEVIQSMDENENNSFTADSGGDLSDTMKNVYIHPLNQTNLKSSISAPTLITNQTETNRSVPININTDDNIINNNIITNENDNLINNNNNLLTIQTEFTNTLDAGNNNTNINLQHQTAIISPVSTTKCDLATFLIQRACKNSTLANYLYWYLCIECETHQESIRKQDERVQQMYGKVLKTFKRTLNLGGNQLKQIKSNLDKQQIFIDELVKLVRNVAKESGNRKKKTEKFQQLLADTDMFRINFTNFEPIPLPLDPNILIKGILPQKVSLFKSALMPSKLTFVTTHNTEYVAMYKYGDDLRQDQLILQMITLMDKLLRRENLDLKLTPYRVLATSSKHGFLQYIDSITVAEVLANEGSIHNFFRRHHPCENGPYGIAPDIMDTYIRSCAGYCVITYLLGVGDRHLDNLLLTTSGKLFHIDFGYILGRDPKPMPPPMKLSKEMVEAMGGVSSEHHHEFRKQCYTSFLHLRRHANVMLNLFSLMVDASVPDIALEPDKAVKKVEENLKLGLTDEEAVQHLQGLLDLSITAVMPALVEQIHKLAQYWRK